MAGDRKVHGDAGLGNISGVVSSLPAGYELGEDRQEGNYHYRLMYNAGNSEADIGDVVSVVAVGGGPYSCTITTTSDGGDAYGGAVVRHVTATTGTYFWGCTQGYPVLVKGGTASIATGGDIMVAIDGAVSTATTGATATVVGQLNTRVVIGRNIGAAASKTITTGTASGDAYVSFPKFRPGAV